MIGAVIPVGLGPFQRGTKRQAWVDNAGEDGISMTWILKFTDVFLLFSFLPFAVARNLITKLLM